MIVSNRFAAGFVLVLASSCASYPERTAEAFGDFRSGHFGRAIAGYADVDEVGSAFLSGAEAGMIALVSGDWEGAVLHYGRAVAAAADIEGRALAGAERLGQGLASWTLNDRMRAYQGEGFERVYVHCGLALAYLAQGELDDVFVEARLANRLLEVEEALYETEYGAGGLGHLVSAVTYEILGQPGEAYVDYLRMHDKGVGTEIAGPALVRLSKSLERSDDLAKWGELYGEGTPLPDGAASVVLIAGLGIGPEKVESRLVLPTPRGLAVFSGASYRPRGQAVTGLRLVADDLSAESAQVEDVAKVARENLEDRLAWMAARSAVRGALRWAATQVAEDELGTGGRIAGDLLSLVLERADLRCWRTLPDAWHAVRLFVPPGVHTLTLETHGGESSALGAYELEPGETMLVYARTLGPRLYAHTVGGRPVNDGRPSRDDDSGAAP